MSALLKSITDLRHPVYRALEATWETNERRYHAGVDATADLTPFKWEAATATPLGEEAATRALNASLTGRSTPAQGYAARQSRAVFPDLMGEFAERLCGELFAKAPEPIADEDTPSGAEGTIDLGALGPLGYDRQGNPTRAQMLWDNADGVGPAARSWDAFWYDEAAAATATGYRWVYVETPGPAATYADELAGRRPYLVGLSPLDVPAWGETAGRLDWAVLKLSERRITVSEGGDVQDEDVPVFHVLVRAGFQGFGPELARGGWWVVDEGGEILRDEAERERTGDWGRTGGEIPLTRLYYERPPKTGAKTASGAPAGLRAGTYTLGAIAAELMDLNSVAYHDTWTSAKRQLFVGVRDRDAAKLMADRSSDPVVFYPAAEGGGAEFYDTGQVSANGALTAEREALTEQAYRFISRELATSPDASGRAREIEHAKGTSPRLASLARNVEEAQNFCLTMLERRWVGRTEGARVTWTKRFDLESVAKAMQPLVESLASAGLSSPTVWADYVIAALREVGADFTSDEGKAKEAAIRAELGLSAEVTAANLERTRAALARDAANAGGDGQLGELPDADIRRRIEEQAALQARGGAES